MIILCAAVIMIIVLVVFCKFYLIKIPAYSVVKVQPFNGEDYYIEAGESNRYTVARHKDVSILSTAKLFSFSEVSFYAGHRMEKTLNNHYCFVVFFPENNIAARDTSLLFNQIRAHGFVSLQKASEYIGDNFYSTNEKYKNYSYPELFKCFLNEIKNSGLNGLYFADVGVTKILYNGRSELNVRNFLMACQTFLVMTSTFEEFGQRERSDSACRQFSADFVKFTERL